MQYAGIGARKAPEHILKLMFDIAALLAIDGHILRTGAAVGSDQAFANGANAVAGPIKLFIPWPSYEEAWIHFLHNATVTSFNENFHRDAWDSVKFHPKYDSLTQGVKRLHARNYLIVEDCQLIICWTEGGAIVGGTGQALRLAQAKNIPMHNLGSTEAFNIYSQRVELRRKEIESYTRGLP